jgi:hypothetical protein
MTDLDRAYRGCLTVPLADRLAREDAARINDSALLEFCSVHQRRGHGKSHDRSRHRSRICSR